jgi:hypothetical protein
MAPERHFDVARAVRATRSHVRTATVFQVEDALA